MKIELVGGPKCGMIVGDGVVRDELKMFHEPGIGDRWQVTYRRTGMRTLSGAMRFDYAGQDRVA